MNSSEKSIQAMSLTNVEIRDRFWAPRIKINHEVTIPHVIEKCKKTGRIDNFSRAAGLLHDGKKPIFPFDDSDVYKIIEGAAYSLIHFPDPKLEKYLDNIIEKIALAQENDGYLYTTRTIDPDNPHIWAGKKRWELVSVLSHELYNIGHLIEAAIAYYQATHKDKILKVAIKSADLIYKDFGQGKLVKIPGHQEIELALIQLYKTTNNKKYLDLAKFFLDIRGSTEVFDFENYSIKFKIYFEDARSPNYNQSHKKVIEQDEAVGHAVRAVYMYSAMTDTAYYFNDLKYKKAIDKIWSNLVSKKLYLTGGIGSQSKGESFGDNYNLPNLEAYAETCAAIGNIFWNYRLFLLFEDAKYIDILERTLYNGFLSGISLDGRKFFYTNPLASKGDISRRSWWKCPCCPSNIVRFIPQIPNYIYTQKNNTIFLNLFVESKVNIIIEKFELSITQQTNYPWDGNVKITVNTPQVREFDIAIRIPGWAQDRPLPSNLYHYMKTHESNATLKINSENIDFRINNGYAKIHRNWKDNDVIELFMPMSIRRVVSDPNVKYNIDKVAIERGPIVYCIESIDNNVDSIFNLKLEDHTLLQENFMRNLLNGIMAITGSFYNTDMSLKKILLIPYYSWNNRGKTQMSVWMQRKGITL